MSGRSIVERHRGASTSIEFELPRATVESADGAVRSWDEAQLDAYQANATRVTTDDLPS